MSSEFFWSALHTGLTWTTFVYFLLRDAAKSTLARLRPSPKSKPSITLTDLPFDVLDRIIRPAMDESKIRAMDGMDDTCRFVKDSRLVSRHLTPYFSELVYGEGHLFLHHKSFGKILHFSPYIRTLVVWLPVFMEPQTATTFWKFGSAAPSFWERAFSEELQEFWDVFHMDTSGEPVSPKRVTEYPCPKRKLGFQRDAFLHFEPCEEREGKVRQWPEDQTILNILEHVLPRLSPFAKVRVMRYMIYPDEMEAMWPCGSYLSLSHRLSTEFKVTQTGWHGYFKPMLESASMAAGRRVYGDDYAPWWGKDRDVSITDFRTHPCPPYRKRNPSSTPLRSGPEVSLKGASLVFQEFSYAKDDGNLGGITGEQATMLKDYLDDKYGVSQTMWPGIFLFITCRAEAPPSDNRPFIVAGCIAVWLGAEDDFPWDLFAPSPARGEELKLPEDLTADLKSYHLPKLATLSRIWKQYFPEALQIQYYVTGIIVELPPVTLAEHFERMDMLPNGIVGSNVSIAFTNGLRPLTQLTRLKGPQPRYVNGEEGDTDYIQSVGFASPGAMITSTTGQQMSAGLLLEKAGQRRLTTAIPCWDTELDTTPERFGDPEYFTLKKGSTHIGHLTQRIGMTGIGLATLKEGVSFTNRFLDIPAVAKSLLCYEDIKFNDQFMVDSSVTGVQRMNCLGVILRDANGMVSQVIFATSAPQVNSHPKVRAGMCGAALVRCKHASGKLSLEEVLASGEIGGFVQWPDLERKSTAPGELICVSECLDQSVDEGWTVVQYAEKRVQREERSAEETEQEGGSVKRAQV